MCLLITPCYACGHKDSPWMLYCNPTRKILGRKHPPLEVCHGKDVSKQEWNVFEPRCSKCEKRYRTGLEKEAKRRKSSGSSAALGSGSLSSRRRTTSLLDGIREMLRMDHGSRKDGGGSESGSDKGDASEAGSLRMLELRNTLTALEGVEVGAIDVEPRIVGGLPTMGSTSSLDSLPCSPRTTSAPTPDDYFS